MVKWRKHVIIQNKKLNIFNRIYFKNVLDEIFENILKSIYEKNKRGLSNYVRFRLLFEVSLRQKIIAIKYLINAKVNNLFGL